MNKKKIAFLIYNLGPGGAERVLSTLANNFSDSFDVHVITIVKTNFFYPLNQSIKKHNCRENEIIKSNIFSSLAENFRLYKKIKFILKHEQINLLIGFMTTSNVLGCLAAKSLKIPCIISERTNPHFGKSNFFWRNLVKYSYPKANYIAVQSQSVKNFYKKIADENKIIILPNPLSKELCISKKIDQNRDNVILNVGRLIKSKNQDLLIKAFSKVNNENWTLIFVGDGPLLEEYKKIANDLNLDEKVKFVGKTNDVATYYNTSKIFVFTSKYEGFPNALIEAMYFELACVSTDCPSGPSEMINHEESGFLIPVGNQNLLETYLKKLMKNESLRISIGKKGYEKSTDFEEITVANKWKSLIEKLINR
jgi:GalNAc-alpha-(1->4)-GalNAc-alpha-(1->3)-diNAcBac-PP-undecaprenol alpha-1,4-N-acetyl-D-galactosaminyltransferase